jgi:hypothetical protein
VRGGTPVPASNPMVQNAQACSVLKVQRLDASSIVHDPCNGREPGQFRELSYQRALSREDASYATNSFVMETADIINHPLLLAFGAKRTMGLKPRSLSRLNDS